MYTFRQSLKMDLMDRFGLARGLHNERLIFGREVAKSTIG